MARPRGRPRKPKPVPSVTPPDQQDRRREATIGRTPPDQQDRQRAHREKAKPKPKPKPVARPVAKPVAPVTPPDQQDRQREARTRATPPDQQDRQQVARADPVIVSRQRRLRAAGYPVAVDGRWGGTSQRYWHEYKTKGKYQPPERQGEFVEAARAKARQARDLHGYDQIERNRVRAANEQMIEWARKPTDPVERLRRLTMLRKDGVGVQRGEIKSARRQVAAQEIERRRQAVGQEAQRLSSILATNPQAVRGLDLDELATLVVDPEMGQLDTARPESVLMIQRWLNGHGYRVAETGRFDTTTARAIEGAIAQSRRARRQEAVAAVAHRYYDSGIVRPGRVEPGFPLGRVPAPGELYAILQAGGFTAAAVARWLEEEYKRRGHIAVDPEYRRWRRELLGNARRGLYGPFDRLHFLPKTAGPVYVGSEQFAEVYAARSFPELERRLVALERKEEQARLAAIKKEADAPWWRDALEKSVLGDDVLAAALGAYKTTEALLLGHARVSFDGGYIASHGFSSPDLDGEAALRDFRAKHPWLYMGLELAADPVNYLPAAVFVAPFKGARRATFALEQAGFRLTASGRLGRAPLLLATPAKGYRGAIDGWGAWTDGMRLYTAKALAADPAALTHAERVFRRAAIGVRRSTALREAMGKAVTARVREVAKLNFKSIPVKGSRVEKKTTGDVFGDISGKVTSKTRQELDASIERLSAQIPEVLPNVVESLFAARASLYAAENSSEYTVIGAQLVARLKEGARERAARDISSREARQYATSVASRQAHAGTPEWVEAYDAAYREMYHATLGRFGSHFAGATDPALAGALAWSLRDFDEMIELVLLPSVQHHLLRVYESQGFKLFDDTAEGAGRWVGHAGDEQAALRFSAAANVSGKTRWIDNPIVGQPFRRSEAHAFIEQEISRRAGSLHGWAAVRRAAGDEVSDEVIDAKIEKIAQEVRDAWVDVPGGLADQRKQIEVPEIYSRFHGERVGATEDVGAAYVQRALDANLDPASPAALLALSMPLDAIRSGGRMGEVRIPDALAFDTDIRRSLGFVAYAIPETVGVEEGIDANLRTFRELARQRHEAVKRGITEVSAHAYRSEGAWMEALRYAQLKPLRAIYYGLTGATATWKFATLALRPAWTVRNILDNTGKVLLESKLDPRVLMAGYKSVPGEGIRTAIALDLAVLRDAAKFLDRLSGTNAAAWFDHAIEVVWSHEPSVLRRIFIGHGVDVPEKVGSTLRMMSPGLEEGLTRVEVELIRDAARKLGTSSSAVRETLRRMRTNLWNLMGTRPEAYFRRALYRSAAERAMRRGLDPDSAAIEAWQTVERTLFDYSKLRVVDDNFKVFFPFLQWWRKNAAFWARTAVTKPWFTFSVLHFDQARRETHPDWPEWMRRYIHVNDVSDAITRVPGVGGWLASHLSAVEDVMSDPMNYLSFSPMYRTFKEENPNLPPDRAGWAFVSDLVDFANDLGLASNPILRKPLEVFGVLNYRAWQRVFPQTDLIAAGTRAFWHDRFGNSGLDLESLAADWLFELMGQETQSALIADRFNEFVQIEMAGQQLRGEPLDRARAEEKIRDYLLLQSLLGYIAGVYPRRMTPEDFQLYDFADEFQQGELDYRSLSADEQQAYQLFKRRRLDPVAFDRRAEMTPLIQAYYRQPDYASKEQFKLDHPEVIPHVERAWTEPLPSSSFVHTQMLVADTRAAFDFYTFRDTLNLRDRDVYRASERALVSPELRNFWRQNDTPADQRRGLIAGAYHGYLNHLSRTFFAIPEGDHAAKQGFLADNPALKRWWDENNDDADDLSGILNTAKADLRDRYFEIINDQGFAAASAFFRDFPFIFEGTSAEDRISPDGTWAARIGGTGRGTVGRRSRTQHANDYLAARKWLQAYFGMPERDRATWLNGNSAGARIVKAYFAKYAHSRGQTQHARDYLATKRYLQTYFGMPKAERAAWLRGGSPAARAVLAYFKKYGKNGATDRKMLRLGKWVNSRNPEIALRLRFWHTYFSLPPDERPAFVHARADEYGVFVYGARGDKERHDREKEWLRAAIAHGMTKKAALYLRVKPLLDVFFSLTDDAEKELFLRANSEVQEYLDQHGRKSLSGNKRVDAIIEGYFKLPYDSPQRTAYLRKHPEVQDYFDRRATPAERAIHNLLEVYFRFPMGAERQDFLLRHPEVEAYFDKKDAERDLLRSMAASFDEADPRLAPHWRLAEEWDADVALRVQQLLFERVRRMYADEIVSAREGRRLMSEGRSNLAL